jgi:hypothetical protein
MKNLVTCRNVRNCFDDKACSLKVYEYRFPHIPQKQGLREHRELLARKGAAGGEDKKRLYP